MKLRIPTLLAAVVATASFLYLADTRSLNASPLVNLETLSGHSVDLAAPDGTTRLISFWSPDCAISERNITALSQLHEQFADEAFEIVAVAMPYSVAPEIGEYIAKNNISYPVAYDQSGGVSDSFPGVRFTPTTFLIDGNGNIAWKHIGQMNSIDFEARINQILNPQQLAAR